MKKTIKELFISIVYACSLYIFSWLALILFNEFIFERGSKETFIAGIIILIAGVILHLFFERKVIKAKEFNFKVFILSFIITWQAFWWVFMFFEVFEIIHEFFHETFTHPGLGLLCGIEYGLFWIEMQIQFITIFLIKGIMWIYKKVKAKKENAQIKE